MTLELILLPRVACQGREITAPRLRGLLALLAVDLRAGCSTRRLVEGLWPDARPERPSKAVQVLVSRLRSQLGAGLIVSVPTGYRPALGGPGPRLKGVHEEFPRAELPAARPCRRAGRGTGPPVRWTVAHPAAH